MNKQEFRDALCLRYGWQLDNVPSHCVCGTSFSVDHAMICRHGGLTFIRHNELRDLTAAWLQEVCHDDAVEPSLLPLDGELDTLHLLQLTVIIPQEPKSMQGASGAGDKVHYLTLGFSIPAHLAIARSKLFPSFVAMSLRRSVWGLCTNC